ncbi:hypothetical protein VE04_01855 [Pseudogymnoascus sp. 24MN13]|nr:hypothetical protein VE04_01855 [Pseudogymnoascus sp. 24MN13]
MPKSKRAKVVHLTQVDKKGKELTLKLFANVQESIDKYQYIFVFSVDNMRNTYLKKVRADLSDSRLFFGKTKVMAKALGSTPETAYQTNTHLLAPDRAGDVGLHFTDRSPEDVSAHFAANTPTDFAGAEHPRHPPLRNPRRGRPELRRLNVPTSLSKGKITLQNEMQVCREGQVLDSRQTRLLKLFGVATAEFRVRVVAYWSAESGTVEEVDGESPEEMEE